MGDQAIASDSGDAWRLARQQFTEHEQRSQQLTVLLQTATANLGAAKSELQKLRTEKEQVLHQITQTEAIRDQAAQEKQALTEQSARADSAAATLSTQLRLLAAMHVEAQDKLEKNKSEFASTLAAHQARLEAYRCAVTPQ